MLSRRTLFNSALVNLQVFTCMSESKSLWSFRIFILVLKSENSIAECSCILLKTVGKRFPVAKILCGRL